MYTVSRIRCWAVAPLMLLAGAFIAYSLPPYLTLDPSRSRIVPPANMTGYYGSLVAHVIFGSTAMITACLQAWPWLRREHPAVHRCLGRLYVFGGVLPAGVMGLTIGAVSPFGPVIRASNVVLAIIWLTVTLTGYRAGRRHSWIEHRRWMTRSIVLTFSVITNRAWSVIWVIVLIPQLNTTFGGNETLMVQTIAGLSGWLGWTLPLVVTEWRLERSALTALTRAEANALRPGRNGRQAEQYRHEGEAGRSHASVYADRVKTTEPEPCSDSAVV